MPARTTGVPSRVVLQGVLGTELLRRWMSSCGHPRTTPIGRQASARRLAMQTESGPCGRTCRVSAIRVSRHCRAHEPRTCLSAG